MAGDRYARIEKVEEDSPATRAGIKAGDEIVALMGRPVTVRQFRLLKGLFDGGVIAGSTVKIKVRRLEAGRYAEHTFEPTAVPK